jgi:hypothetical protein
MNPEVSRYDDYYAKHFARYRGWLPASKEFKVRIRKKGIKYFTLCAREAIDVFMFEKERLLARDELDRLPDVVICESEVADAAEIIGLVRPPYQGAILVGRLEDILTFQETEGVRKALATGDSRSRELRRQIRLKHLSDQLSRQFPFDIVNFDCAGNLLNPSKPENKRLHPALRRVFELQKPAEAFLLFVTTPISHVDANLAADFQRDMDRNISDHPEIGGSLQSAKNSSTFDALTEQDRTVIGFAKSVVLRMARECGWNGEHKGIYVYENRDSRRMMSSVIQFSRAASTPDENQYVQDLVRVITSMPEFCSYQESLGSEDLKEHLRAIVEYRESRRSAFGLGN